MSLLQFVRHFHITGAGWYWITWFFGGFGVYEGWALIYNTQDTLSWQFWGLEQVNFSDPVQFSTWTPVHYAIGVVLLAGMVWLFGHLVFGIWRLCTPTRTRSTWSASR